MSNKGQMRGAMTDAATIVAQSDLNERHKLFILELLRGRNEKEAALASGYREGSAGHVLRHAGVQRVLQEAMQRFIVGELAPKAFGTISKLMVDEKTPAGVRATLALGVLDRAGFSVKRLEKGQDTAQDLANQSPDQLREAVARIQREIEGRMRDVTPVSAPDNTQAIDMYE